MGLVPLVTLRGRRLSGLNWRVRPPYILVEARHSMQVGSNGAIVAMSAFI
ncbi:hypothetical protein Thermo_01967 [Thermoplasmatales archaeon]|nr:hypothetical protein Thermo_01967 [Thermoplasmatales archaeon]